MFKSEYDQIIREHFDLSDTYTRKYITSLTEDAQQDQLLAALSSALYDKIVSKVDDIDFGSIPLSRGDITKVQGFASTEECLNIIRNLVIQYKQNPVIVDVVLSAVNNIKERKALFIKAYALNTELPMLIYNTMVLSIERSTSLMIATCIEYVKDPTSTTLKMALDKAAYNKTMDDLLYKQLINFNNMCHNGQLDKTLEAVMKNNVRAAREEVENMYNMVHSIDEDEPETVPNAPQEVMPDESPFDTDSTIEPASNRLSDDQPMTGDTEIPAPNEFPEDTEDDDVEPENIPTVNPGDDITDSDTAINELEDEDDYDETNNGVQFMPNTDRPVNENILSSINSVGAVIGGVIGGTAHFVGSLLKLIIGIPRIAIYYFYYSKMKISDYLEIQADLLEANANDLQYSATDLSDAEKKKVIKKQMKIVAKLRKWSNMFSIDSKQASNKASKQAQDDDRNRNKVRPNDDGDDSIF